MADHQSIVHDLFRKDRNHQVENIKVCMEAFAASA